MAHTCYPNTQGPEAKGLSEYKAILGYIAYLEFWYRVIGARHTWFGCCFIFKVFQQGSPIWRGKKGLEMEGLFFSSLKGTKLILVLRSGSG